MKILVTGGLGFIGVNTCLELSKNNEIHVIDNSSRKGNMVNYKLLEQNENIKLHIKDIRNFHDLSIIFQKIMPDSIIHLAGQVAVTFSVQNPREDFEINLLGTFNILECIRIYKPDCSLIYASTNKVYGEYDVEVLEFDKKYEYANIIGINEKLPLDFHSPYGCSKGGADQYVRDYSRIYNLKTVVLRQSCIYGENQFGIEDQGWVAWFTIASTYGKMFSIYGNGKQVRDVLYIEDLIDLYSIILHNIENCSGNVYNVGGGYENSLSLLELIHRLEIILNKKIIYEIKDWRPGDQKIYISDITKLNNDLNWHPKISINEGLNNLSNWVQTNFKKFKKLNLI